MYLILFWALVALIGQAECKCSPTSIANDERSIAYVCTHGDLNDLEEISNEVDWIEFSVSRFHLIPDNAFWRFKNLRRLSFYNCHINFISPDAFAGLNNLEWLILHGTRISVARSTWFRPLRNLRKLTLDRCNLVHIEPDTFRMLPRLEVLSLRDNDLGCLPTEELSYLRLLRSVRIDRNPWICECRRRMDEYFRSRSIVQEVECLREIAVCRKYQCMAPIEFSAVPNVPNTEYAFDFNTNRTIIRGNEFQTSVLTSLDRLPDKITWLEISDLIIDTLPRYAFFRFGNSLTMLDLNNCRINVIESEAFAGLYKLQRLSLVGNRFPVVTANWFLNLANLQQLILQRNEIQEIERTALWHVGDTLRHLDIGYNRLRCIAIEELAEMKKLERLDAMNNPWLCPCWRKMERFLRSRILNIDLRNNAGRCYESEKEILDGSTDWGQQQITHVNTSVTIGKVHWTSFEETIKHTNTSTIRPHFPTRPPETHPMATTQSSIYKGSCRPMQTASTNSVYVCQAITSIEELNVIPQTVHTIRVILSNIQKIPQNAFARFDGYLSILELQDCGIDKIEPGAFESLYNLQRLSLRNNQLQLLDLDMAMGLRSLTHLDVSHNNIYQIQNDIFKHLPSLTHLDVSENAMNCIGVEYMESQLRHLYSLNISRNPWSCLCATKLAEFLDKRRIPHDKDSLLSKEDCYAPTSPEVTSTPPVISTTSAPQKNDTIEGTCSIYQTAMESRYQCTGGNLPLLQSIPPEVTAIEFSDGHLPRLPPDCFAKFTNLRELIIRNSGLTTLEDGAFNSLDKLEKLTIQDNSLKMIRSSWFALGNLERLDLRGNSIKYIESGSFRYLNRLTYLNLEGNDLNCIYTSDLNDMPNLYIVEFAGNPLRWRCRHELEQFLEARKIRFVKIENSCEGKTLVRNLLLQNKTDGSYDCTSDCSEATNVLPRLSALSLLLVVVTLIR